MVQTFLSGLLFPAGSFFLVAPFSCWLLSPDGSFFWSSSPILAAKHTVSASAKDQIAIQMARMVLDAAITVLQLPVWLFVGSAGIFQQPDCYICNADLGDPWQIIFARTLSTAMGHINETCVLPSIPSSTLLILLCTLHASMQVRVPCSQSF